MLRNINRIMCFVLVLCFSFSMSSCYRLKDFFGKYTDQTDLNNTDSEQTEPISYGYESIECKKSNGTKFGYYVFDDSCFAISIGLPVEWTICEKDTGYDIVRDNENIGTLKNGRTSIMPNETVCYNETDVSSGVRCDWSIILVDGEFFHRIIYSSKINKKDCVMTLEVGYSELDAISLKRARYSLSVKETRTDPGLGTINLSAKPGEKPILILGNSFIGSSRVGAILQSMCDASGNNNYQIIWESRGMATVSNNWNDYIYEMQSGSFAAVFMCGFYGSEDVSAFKTFLEACQVSNTPLVIFPAHNEGNGAAAANRYSTVYYLAWEHELNMLISSGVDMWDLCIDDYHGHSRPLAGYVGAHMIYRSLFGEMPPILSQYDDVSYSTVVQKLGDYSETACITLIEENIYKMN